MCPLDVKERGLLMTYVMGYKYDAALVNPLSLPEKVNKNIQGPASQSKFNLVRLSLCDLASLILDNWYHEAGSVNSGFSQVSITSKHHQHQE